MYSFNCQHCDQQFLNKNHSAKYCSRKCQNTFRRSNISDIIKRFNEVHNHYYDYSAVIYNGMDKPCEIKCLKHGVFLVRPSDHINYKQGCHECYLEEVFDMNAFLEKCRDKHGEKYDYSISDYTGSNREIKIMCREHGVFSSLAANHLAGHGCKKCSNIAIGKANRKSLKYFVDKANEVHQNSYEYHLCDPTLASKAKQKIVCKQHGVFQQNFSNHLSGQGCPKCVVYGRYNEVFFENNTNFKNIKGILYLLEFTDEKEHFYKIGISKRDIKTRWRKTFNYNMRIILNLEMNLHDAFKIEQDLLHRVIYKIRKPPSRKIGGDQECFVCDDTQLDDILSDIIQLFNHRQIQTGGYDNLPISDHQTNA